MRTMTAALALVLLPALALAQTTPNWTTGYVPPSTEWNALWASKADYTGLTAEIARAEAAEATLTTSAAAATAAATSATSASAAATTAAAAATAAAANPVTVVAASGTAQSLAFAASGNATYDVTKTGNVAFTLSGGRAGQYQTLTIVVRPGAGGFTESFPATIKWPGGTAPTPSTSAVNVYTVSTPDAGTTLIGSY